MTNYINDEDIEYTVIIDPKEYEEDAFLLAVPKDGIYIIEIPDCKKSIQFFLKAGQLIKIRDKKGDN